MLPTVLQYPYPEGKGLRSSLAFDLLCYFVYLGEYIAVAVDKVGYLRGSVHDGGVVPAAEGLPYLGQRFIGELSGEVHGDLAGVGEPFGAALADEVRLRHAEVPTYLELDELYGDLAVRLIRQNVPEDLFGEGHGDLTAVERGVGQDAHQGPLKLADVRRDLRRDERQHLVVYLEAVHDRLFAKDRYPRL